MLLILNLVAYSRVSSHAGFLMRPEKMASCNRNADSCSSDIAFRGETSVLAAADCDSEWNQLQTVSIH